MAATRAINLQTTIPGPKSKAILERKQRVVADPLSIYIPIVIAEGRGATITDVDGNTFIDFTGGVGCLNVGHSHPRVVEAAQQQLERFAHTDFTIVPYEVYVELAERLTELTPVRKPAKAAFFNAGTEAVENAVKFARSYTKRPAVICFEGAFHGRTLLSMTMTSKTHPYKAGLGPFAPEVYRVPFAQDYRGPSADEALAALERGVELDDGPTAPAQARRVGPSRIELSIHEGRKHQVKRMFEAVGHPVRRLHRPRYAGLTLDGLRPGEWRELERDEIEELRRHAGLAA
jgi:4-aminobutyrate aminotransferase-like enzyme